MFVKRGSTVQKKDWISLCVLNAYASTVLINLNTVSKDEGGLSLCSLRLASLRTTQEKQLSIVNFVGVGVR